MRERYGQLLVAQIIRYRWGWLPSGWSSAHFVERSKNIKPAF
jgi:hypothetical protein